MLLLLYCIISTVDRYLSIRRPGDILVHKAAEPHMMVVPDDEMLLAVYAWIEDLDGEYWWCDHSVGSKYVDVGSAGANAEEYYDNMAEDYESVVRAWGYNCPEVRLSILSVERQESDINSDTDCCCQGSGASQR